MKDFDLKLVNCKGRGKYIKYYSFMLPIITEDKFEDDIDYPDWFEFDYGYTYPLIKELFNQNIEDIKDEDILFLEDAGWNDFTEYLDDTFGIETDASWQLEKDPPSPYLYLARITVNDKEYPIVIDDANFGYSDMYFTRDFIKDLGIKYEEEDFDVSDISTPPFTVETPNNITLMVLDEFKGIIPDSILNPILEAYYVKMLQGS